MSRTSRIPHPPGSRYVALYQWAVRRFGVGGAAVIGLLDFLDRAKLEPNQPLASRARIIFELEGIVGKHVVDRALHTLLTVGAIRRCEQTTMGSTNWETRVEYALDIHGLAQLLATPYSESSGNSRNRESRQLPKTEPEPGPPPGVPLNKKEVDVITTTTGGGGDADAVGGEDATVDDLIEAAVWAAQRSPTGIKNEGGFRARVRARIIQNGPSPDDLATFRGYRTAHAKATAAAEAARVQREAAAMSPQRPPLSREAALARARQAAAILKGRAVP